MCCARRSCASWRSASPGRYHLAPLSGDETRGYVRHRLRVAGATRDLFTDGALREVHRLAGGVPRVINVICDRALLGAYSQGQHRIPAKLVRRSVAEVYGRPVLPLWSSLGRGGVFVASVAVLAFGAWQLIRPDAAPKADTRRIGAKSPRRQLTDRRHLPSQPLRPVCLR